MASTCFVSHVALVPIHGLSSVIGRLDDSLEARWRRPLVLVFVPPGEPIDICPLGAQRAHDFRLASLCGGEVSVCVLLFAPR